MIRPIIRSLAIAAVWTVIFAPIAHAHGGIAGPDELGPPVIISTLLGIAGYWTVILWPSGRGRARRKPNNVRRMAR